MVFDLLIKDGTLVIPESGTMRAHVGVNRGKIVALLGDLTGVTAAGTYDASGKYVFPGVVDPHLHIGLGNGNVEWETETRSAAIGGVTTALTYLMSGKSYHPLAQESLEVAGRDAHIDYGFHVVPSTPLHLDEMESYSRSYGIRSYKYFTSYRGDEGAHLGIQGTDDGFMFRYLRQVAGLPNGVACIHPENIEVVWELRKGLKESGRDDLKAWNDSRPDFVEAQSAASAAFYGQIVGCPVYIVHVSGKMVANELRMARTRPGKAPIYIETCPHFLTHTSEDNIGPLGKVNPPLRFHEDIEALWDGLKDGTIDTVGSDHVARKKNKKTGSIWTCSAGFPGTGIILPMMLSEGYHKRGLSLQRIAQVTSSNPSRIFHKHPDKGSIAVGSDADFAIVDLEREEVVTPERLQSIADYSLYDGRTLKGWPVATFLRGELVAEEGKLVGKRGYGKYLRAS